MPPGSLPLFCALLVVWAVLGAHAGVDYCSVHTFRSNSSWLQFTKEMSSREYAVPGAFKSLHCCAKGYRSIEWYKDGRAYPWPGSFILYPESANQTVYSPAVRAADAGNYSCLVRNDTSQTWHDTRLSLLEAEGADDSEVEGGPQYSGLPLFTYEPRDQVVRLGEDARFFCEAFVGRVNLPDAGSSIFWRRETAANETTAAPPDTAVSEPRRPRGLVQKDTSREDEQILGMYLEIRGVRREDLGQYTCLINSLDFHTVQIPAWLRQAEALHHSEPDPPPPPQRRMVLQTALVVLVVLSIVVLVVRFGSEMRVVLRDAIARQPAHEDKLWDVVLCYEEADAELALGVLLPALQHSLGFRCFVRVLPPGRFNEWARDLSADASRSRRVVCVLSPALLSGEWAADALTVAMTTLLTLNRRTVFVALQAFPAACSDPKDERGRDLRGVVRASPPVLWSASSESRRRAFWTALRLRLPPRRRSRRESRSAAAAEAAAMAMSAAGGGPGVAVAAGGGGKQPLAAPGTRRPHRTCSHESLEVLV